MCFNPSPERRVPSPNRYMAFAKFCFCKNNKRTIDPNGITTTGTLGVDDINFVADKFVIMQSSSTPCADNVITVRFQTSETLCIAFASQITIMGLMNTQSQTLDFPSCSNIPTSTRSLVLSTRSHPAHFPPHCSSPNLFQSCPALGKPLPQYFFGYDPHTHSPHSPDLCVKYEHRTSSCALSNSCTNPFLIVFLFLLDDPKFLEIVVECM